MDFDDNNHQRSGWLRSVLRLRAPGRRAHAVMRLLFTDLKEQEQIE